MKKLICALGLVMAFCAIAANENLTDEEKAAKKAAAQQKMLEKTGGIVEKAGTGKIVIVNCQTKIPSADVVGRVDSLNKTLRVAIETRDGSWKIGDKTPADANATIYVVNEPTLPISLVAVEAHWGVVNVSELTAGSRFNKAFIRTAILTLGGGVSQFKGSPMQTVSTPADLDKIVNEGLSFDAMSSIMGNLQKLGVTQPKKTSYRKAIQEGWAAQPTNEYQKVIWEELHASPTNPMRIKFDPKKGM